MTQGATLVAVLAHTLPNVLHGLQFWRTDGPRCYGVCNLGAEVGKRAKRRAELKPGWEEKAAGPEIGRLVIKNYKELPNGPSDHRFPRRVRRAARRGTVLNCLHIWNRDHQRTIRFTRLGLRWPSVQ